MAILSITRLRIRSLRSLPGFAIATWRSQRQLRRSPGFLSGYLATGPGRTFWTVTLWSDEEAMRAFRRNGPHLKAMPKLLHWCDEAAVATLAVEAVIPPEPDEAAAALSEHGRLSKVLWPSPAHRDGGLWPDRKVPRRTPLISARP